MQVSTALDPALLRKTVTKFAVRRWIGEPYVGKRMKLRHLRRLLRDIDLPPNPRLLEVGSGDGVFTHWLSRRFQDAEVDGVELDPAESAACAAWAQRCGQTRLHFRQGNVLDMKEQGVYDLIICLDVLEHIADDQAAVARMMAALKPGGWLVVHVPNLWYQRLGGSMHTCPPDEAWQINPGHVRNGYTPEQLGQLLQSASAEHVESHPRHGRWSDLAHSVYRWLERPAFLRLLAVPLVDTIWMLDRLMPSAHCNTVFGIARKPSA